MHWFQTYLPERRQICGLLLLILANVLWVAAAEITRYVFLNLNFKRPFFSSYVKLSLLTLYLLHNLWKIYKLQMFGILGKANGNFVNESLSPAEYEPVFVSEESELDQTPRRVRFAQVCEVRHLPTCTADDAKRARTPVHCICTYFDTMLTTDFWHSLNLAFMWILCTVSYQAALLHSTVSSVNLLSASSSLFVLILSALFMSSPSDRFTLKKLILVLSNLVGVALVSQYAASPFGTLFSFLSAFFYALYLLLVSRYQNSGHPVNISYTFGLIGLLTILFYTPFLFILDWLSIESLYPLPNRTQWIMLFMNGAVGAVLSDILWLYATLLTSPLAGSVSLSICIPLSFIADNLLRSQSTSFIQLLASVPIIGSFLGAAFLKTNTDSNVTNYTIQHNDANYIEESLKLIDEIGSVGEDESIL